MKSFVNNNKISQSDYGLFVVFTPIDTVNKYRLRRFNVNISPHLVCSVCYVNVHELINNINRKSKKIENEKANSVSTVLSKIKSLNIPNFELKNVKDVENHLIEHILHETVNEKPDFLLFDINFVSPLLNINMNSFSGVEFNSISGITFFEKFVSPFLLNLNNSSDNIESQFSKSDINKFVFLFRGINWRILQKFFKNKGIIISGGFGSKRVYLNTSNYFLSKFLSHIGYSSTDVYYSYKISRNLESSKLEEFDSKIEYEYKSRILININNLDLNLLSDRMVELESKISNENSTLEKTNSRYAGFVGVSEKKEIQNQKKLNRMRDAIQDMSKEVSIIKSDILKLKDENKLLISNNLDFESVENIFYLKFSDKHVNNYVLNIKDKIKYYSKNNIKRGFSTAALSNKRFYSTTNIMGNSQSFENSNLIIEKKEILPKNKLGEFKELYENDPLVTLIKNIMLSDLSNYEKQINIERYISEFWENQLYKKLSSENSLFSNKYGIGILLKNIEKTKRHLEDYINNKTYMKNKWYKNYILCIESEILISIVISNLIPFVVKYMNSNDHNSITILEKIGKKIIKNVFKSEWLKYEKGGEYKLKLLYDKKEFPINKGLTTDQFEVEISHILGGKITDSQYASLGRDISEIVSIGGEQNLFWFDILRVDNNSPNFTTKILLGKDVNKYITNILAVDRKRLPMISEPLKWDIEHKEDNSFTIKNYGGFLCNEKNKVSFINQNPINVGKMKFLNKDVIDCINYLGKIKCSINSKVLNFIFDLYLKNDKRILDLIKLNLHENTKELTELTEKSKIFINKERGAPNYQKALGEIENIKDRIALIQETNSKFYQDKEILKIAMLLDFWCDLNNENSFFIPYFIDWRGRIYCDSDVFSHQGTELCKSLIQFKDGCTLNDEGLKNLKIYTANCFGLDKNSIMDRLKWVDDNFNKIINININIDLLFEAKEPLIFLACCLELKEFNKDKNFVSKLPIYTDATCNGLQHLATMIKSVNLAELVNIRESSEYETPKDLYSNVANNIKEKIRNYAMNNKSHINLLNLNINRAFVKKSIMTIPYGITQRGLTEDLRETFFRNVSGSDYKLKDKEFNKLKESSLFLNLSSINVLGKIIYSELFESYPNLQKLVKYLKDMNKVLKELNLSVIWIAPEGVILEQKYVRTKKTEIKTTIYKKRKSMTKHVFDLDNKGNHRINFLKQDLGIVPNFVHSLDAANVRYLIKQLLSYDKQINIFTIHDCFASHANKIGFIKLEVKLAFLNIYSNKDFLNKSYHNFMIEYIKKSGFILSDDNKKILSFLKKGKTNTDLILPEVPNFDNENLFNLKDLLLKSQYFTN